MASNTAVFTLLVPLIGPSPLIHGQVHNFFNFHYVPFGPRFHFLLQLYFLWPYSHDINRLTR